MSAKLPPILIVDDEPDVREVTAAILAHHGYRVLPAVDGAEAVTLLAPWVLKYAVDDLTGSVTRAKLLFYGATIVAIAIGGGASRFMMRRVIIGASRGIGEATAKALAKKGAAVSICARRKDRLDELVDACERLGFEGLYSSDHYLSVMRARDRGSNDAWTILSAVAARTERIRLGTMVSPVTFRHPTVLAKVAATVDAIGPLGAKSQGECAINPVAPAVSNALADATGVRFAHLPFAPDRLFGALAGVK